MAGGYRRRGGRWATRHAPRQELALARGKCVKELAARKESVTHGAEQ